MAKQRKTAHYPEQIINKRGIVELHMSPASMFDLLSEQIHLSREQILQLAQERVSADPVRETFWMLVAYIAMSSVVARD